MGRKKKTNIEPIAEVNSPSIEKAVKVSETPIGYKGKVKIELKHGDKTYKTIHYNNSGKSPLFDFLLDCLAGNYNDYNRPQFIMLKNTDKENCLNVPQPLINLSLSYGENGNISYEFLIPYNSFYADKKSFQYIYLISQLNYNQLNPSAVIDLGEAEDIDNTTNLSITWVLSVANSATTI